MFFVFKDAATTQIYTCLHTLALHDALQISGPRDHLRHRAANQQVLHRLPTDVEAGQNVGIALRFAVRAEDLDLTGRPRRGRGRIAVLRDHEAVAVLTCRLGLIEIAAGSIDAVFVLVRDDESGGEDVGTPVT